VPPGAAQMPTAECLVIQSGVYDGDLASGFAAKCSLKVASFQPILAKSLGGDGIFRKSDPVGKEPAVLGGVTG